MNDKDRNAKMKHRIEQQRAFIRKVNQVYDERAPRVLAAEFFYGRDWVDLTEEQQAYLEIRLGVRREDIERKVRQGILP